MEMEISGLGEEGDSQGKTSADINSSLLTTRGRAAEWVHIDSGLAPDLRRSGVALTSPPMLSGNEQNRVGAPYSAMSCSPVLCIAMRCHAMYCNNSEMEDGPV